jgi:hypothetical protein
VRDHILLPPGTLEHRLKLVQVGDGALKYVTCRDTMALLSKLTRALISWSGRLSFVLLDTRTDDDSDP